VLVGFPLSNKKLHLRKTSLFSQLLEMFVMAVELGLTSKVAAKSLISGSIISFCPAKIKALFTGKSRNQVDGAVDGSV
jgi:hypothetical protein